MSDPDVLERSIAVQELVIADLAPCPWVIKIMTKLDGTRYPTVMSAGMTDRRRNTETIPTWVIIDVPARFHRADPSAILAACHDGRIAW
jgi:hypothetical protein